MNANLPVDGPDASENIRHVPFKSVFVAVVLGTALVVAAMLVNGRRRHVEVNQPSAALVEASGKCAECHRRETSAIVDQFERSQHAVKGVTCLDCHRPVEGQPSIDHRGFVIAKALTAKNCAQCHAGEYDQFTRSRHAAPSWAAVNGPKDFSPEQLAIGERWHKGWVNRAPNPIATMEGQAAMASGCNACHAIGKPNADGSLRHVHQLPRASLGVGRARAPPQHLRPVPHGSGSLPDRDLRGIEARRALRRPARPAQPARRSEAPHDRGHERADLRHLPHERPRGARASPTTRRSASPGTCSRPCRRSAPATSAVRPR